MGSETTLEVATLAGIGKPTSSKRRTASVKPARTKPTTVDQRSSEYRGKTLEEARAAYHADARAMSRMGYAPTSEDWSTVLEHVLTVRYVFEPERQPAVLAALDEIEAEPRAEVPEPPPAPRNRLARSIDRWLALPLELRLSAGGIGGLLVGLALCLAVGLVSGDSPDMVSVLGFGTIGLLLGASLGLIPAEGI
jgi:hypothetical protein